MTDSPRSASHKAFCWKMESCIILILWIRNLVQPALVNLHYHCNHKKVMPSTGQSTKVQKRLNLAKCLVKGQRKMVFPAYEKFQDSVQYFLSKIRPNSRNLRILRNDNLERKKNGWGRNMFQQLQNFLISVFLKPFQQAICYNMWHADTAFQPHGK